MTAVRSHTAAARSRSWVMNSSDTSNSLRSESMIAITSAWIVTSSAVVGSSARIRRGLVSSAVAIITRCSMPPESSCGILPQPPLAVVDPDLAQHVDRLCLGLGTRDRLAQRLGHEVADPAHRIGVRAGILEHHRGLVSVVAELAAAQAVHVAAVEGDGAVHLRPCGQQPRDRPHRHRLARARLAHQPQRLARERARS